MMWLQGEKELWVGVIYGLISVRMKNLKEGFIFYLKEDFK